MLTATLVALVLAAALVGSAEGKRKRNLQKNYWEPLVLLGVIVACITLPLLGMLAWRVLADPATPLIAREVWFKLMECCCDDGTWRAKQRKKLRRAQRAARRGGFREDEDEEVDEDELLLAEKQARRSRRERRRNLEALADEVLADDLRREVEAAATL